MPQDSELHRAAKDGDVQGIKDLLQQGSEVNAPGAQGRTALQRALGGGFDDCAGALLDGGADPKIIDAMKRTCLHWAVLGPQVEMAQKCLELLFERNGDAMGELINKQTKSGATALHCAVEGGHGDMARYLFDRGADTEIKNDDEETPVSLLKKAGLPKNLFSSNARGSAAGRNSSADGEPAKKKGGFFGRKK